MILIGPAAGKERRDLSSSEERRLAWTSGRGWEALTFPREIHNELISDGRAKPHPAGFANVVSYYVREPEDVPEVVELFRMSYERAKASAERRKQRTERRRYSNDERGQAAFPAPIGVGFPRSWIWVSENAIFFSVVG